MTVHASKVIGFLQFTTVLLIAIHDVLSFSVGVSHILRWRSMKHTTDNNFRHHNFATQVKAANEYTEGTGREEAASHARGGSQQQYRPLPVMPSQLFQQLALSQLELLANSLQVDGNKSSSSTTASKSSSSSSSSDNHDSSASSFSSSSSKVKSMALYLPQENPKTGQLEFTPVVLYNPPGRDRVFIAPEANSGIPPTLPRTLTKLPGFSHARTLLPGYPMVSSSSSSSSASGAATYIPAGIGMVEEVLCDLSGSNACALSVPLFSASQTVGLLLVSPSVKPPSTDKNKSVWTRRDREQVAKAAESLSLAMCMDQERASLQNQSEHIKEALSNSLHQVKNPLQALRTYGKLLQRRIADTTTQAVDGGTSRASFDASKNQQLLELANHLMVQSDRLTERLQPVDGIIDSMGRQSSLLSNNRLLPVARSHSNMTKKNDNKKPEEPYLLLPSRALAVTTPPSTSSTRADRGRWTTPFLPPSNDSKENIPTKVNLNRGDTPATTTTRRRRYGDRGVVQNAIQSHNMRFSNEPRAATRTTMFDSSAGMSASSSSSSSPPPLEMAFVPDVLEPIFNGFYAIALDKGISFVVSIEQGNDDDDDDGDELPGCFMNVQSLQEAVSNVLDNAFKYVILPKPKSPFSRNPSPKVLVQLKSNTDDSSVIILVQDNGPGIPHELQEEIFQRGYRSSTATDSGINGTGLGLSIARSLMQEMGGRLQLVVDSPSSPTRTASNSTINKRRRRDSDDTSRSIINLLDGTVMKFVLYRKPVLSGAVKQ